MARPAKIIRLEHFERRVAKREKTKMGRGRAEDHAGLDTTCPREMGKPRIVTDGQGALRKDTGAFVKR